MGIFGGLWMITRTLNDLLKSTIDKLKEKKAALIIVIAMFVG